MDNITRLDSYRRKHEQTSPEIATTPTLESFFADVATYKDGLFSASLMRTYEDMQTQHASEKFILSELISTYLGLIAIDQEFPYGVAAAQLDKAILPSHLPIDKYDDTPVSTIITLKSHETSAELLPTVDTAQQDMATVVSLAAFRNRRSSR